MKIKVEVTACDLDKAMPARSYGIIVDDETYELDLCAPHAKPIEDLIEQARKAREEQPAAPAPVKAAVPDQAPPMQFNPPTPPAPKVRSAATAERPAPRRGGRRRPKVMSLEEIEAQKQAQQSEG
ncbi:DNA binding protein [Streptomyces phage GreenWeasel]|nr:DNA binding protein [Streptomyces phage GreenWeasel]